MIYDLQDNGAMMDSSNMMQPRTYTDTVLIVDDHDNNRFYLNFLMTKYNLKSAEAENGTKALELWGSGTFSYIFLDLEMPDMNGLQVATQIRKSDSGVAIIMCSANDESPSIAEAARCDCDMYIVKPLMINVLMELIPTMNREELRNTEKMPVIYNTGGKRLEPRRGRRSTQFAIPIVSTIAAPDSLAPTVPAMPVQPALNPVPIEQISIPESIPEPVKETVAIEVQQYEFTEELPELIPDNEPIRVSVEPAIPAQAEPRLDAPKTDPQAG